MTGEEIRQLRQTLGLGVPQFAQLLGVHVATAYRWEAVGVRTVTLDPLHAALMARLQQTLEARPVRAEQEEWGQQLLKGVLIGGTLAGLAVLLAGLIPTASTPTKTSAPRKRHGR